MTSLALAKPISKQLAEKLARAEAVLAQEAAKGNENGRRPGPKSLKKSVSWKHIGLVMAMDFLMDNTPAELWESQPQEIAAHDVKQGVDDGKMKATVQWRHPIELSVPEDKRVYDSEIPTQLFVRGKNSVEKAKQVQREKSIFGTVYLAGQLIPPNPADPEPEPPDDLSELQEIPYLLIVAETKDDRFESKEQEPEEKKTASTPFDEASPFLQGAHHNSPPPVSPPPEVSLPTEDLGNASYRSRRQQMRDAWDNQPPARPQPADMANPTIATPFVRPPSPPPIKPQSPPRSRPSAKRPYSRPSSPPPRAASPPPRPPVPPSQSQFTPGVRVPAMAEPPHLANDMGVFQPPPPPAHLYSSNLPPTPPQPPPRLQHLPPQPPPHSPHAYSPEPYEPEPPGPPSLDLEALLSDSSLLSHLQSIQAAPRPLSASEKLQALISATPSGPPPLPPTAPANFPGEPPPAWREVRRIGFGPRTTAVNDGRFHRDSFGGPQRPFVDERFLPERPRAFEDFSSSRNDFDGAPPPPPLPPPPPRDMGPNRKDRLPERVPDVRDFKRVKGRMNGLMNVGAHVKEPQRCKNFDNGGVCRFGTQCHFLHVQR